MTAWEPLASFLPHVSVYVPDAPQPAALMMLRLAAAEFCEATALWREIVTVDLPDDPVALEIAQESSTIVRIERAEYDGLMLAPTALVDVSSQDIGADGLRGIPHSITQITENTAIIAPWPTEPGGSLFLSLILKPVVGARFGVSGATTLQTEQNRVPRFLFDNHADTIAHGAVSKLMMMPRQSFTDPAAAAYHLAAFDAAKRERASHGFSGQQSARPRIKAQFF
jgi:hypothetical protein